MLMMFVYCSAGIPSTGGDFVGPVNEAGRFVFSATENNPCIDVFIFGDDVFEGEEEFDVEFDVFLLEDDSTVSTLTGVTVDPRSTTVIIEDIDSKYNKQDNETSQLIHRTKS